MCLCVCVGEEGGRQFVYLPPPVTDKPPRHWKVGTLYCCYEDVVGEGVNRCLQFVLSQHLVPAMLAELHDSPTGGHLGLKKVLEEVKRGFYWVGQQHDVQKWCDSC